MPKHSAQSNAKPCINSKVKSSVKPNVTLDAKTNAPVVAWVTCYIALGANLGEPVAQLDNASDTLAKDPLVRRLVMSPIYRSVPHGDIPQPDYYNAVLAIETQHSPETLLQLLHAIEADNGRERKVRWAARTLDLDLILYGDAQVQHKDLTVPHPRAHEREFVVKPLYDIAPNGEIPAHGSVADLLTSLPLDNLAEVRRAKTYHD